MSWALAGACALLVGAIVHMTWLRRQNRANAQRLEHATSALEHLQRAFSRFTPATVVEEIIERGVSTTAQKKDVTVLFADLQGFTRMSERLDPVTLVEILNGYFERMSAAVRDHHGHVSKFMGDGMMALFGALEQNPWDAKDAVEAALAMRASLQRFNDELKARDLPELAFGIGIHRGPVVAGVMGSQHLLEFTVIGDAVNVASRVEGLTRAHGVDILVTEPVSTALRQRFKLREMPPSPVKGKTEPLRTFALEGRASTDMHGAAAVGEPSTLP
jgi:class 3 adenylate cyclase